MIVYGSYLSQPTRMVLWTSALLNIPFEFKKVDSVKGEQRLPDFLKLNPNAVFPVIQEKSGFVLYESNAIARYLCGESNSLYPSEPKTRALVNQWLDWKHASLRQGCAGIVRRKAMALMMKDITKHSMYLAFQEIKEEREARLLLEALEVLEAQLKKTGLFIVEATSQPTLADLAVFEEVEQLRLLPFNEEPPYGSNIQSKFPNVAAWQTRMRQVPKYEEIHNDLLHAIKAVDEIRKRNAKV